MSDDVPAIYCEVRKTAYRQTKDGIVVSFLCHPNDVPNDLAVAPLGTRYMLALVEIDDDEQPVSRSERGKRQYRNANDMSKAVIRAAELPKDERFRAWLGGDYGDMATERAAIDYIREQCCNGGSRGAIGDDQECYEKFLAMEQEYRVATGLAAEPRP